MPFDGSKKILGTIGLMAVLIPFLFLSSAQKAEATVPVADASVLAKSTSILSTLGSVFSTLVRVYNTVTGVLDEVTGLEVKEYILDPLVKALAKSLLDSLTNSIVTWIRTGNWGDPLFITDPEAFFTDAADQATGRFMKEFLSSGVYNFICSPFRIDLLLGLKRTNRYSERMRCTLSTVLANAQNGVEFGTAIRNGDWGDWMSATLNMQNNPAGALLISLDELSYRQDHARDTAKTESIFNAGFLSMKECTDEICEIKGTDASGNEYCISKKCIKYKSTSPGKWIQTQLSEATGIEFQELALADEIDEIITAAIGRLLNEIMGHGITSGRELPAATNPPKQYVTLKVGIDGNGSVTISPQKAVYEKRLAETVTLTAVPGDEYDFDHWSGDISGAISPITLIMDSNKTATAHFSYMAPPPPVITTNFDDEVLASVKLNNPVAGTSYYGYYRPDCSSPATSINSSSIAPLTQQWFSFNPKADSGLSGSNFKIDFLECVTSSKLSAEIYILNQNNEKITTVPQNPIPISFVGRKGQWLSNGNHTDEMKYLIRVSSRARLSTSKFSVYWSFY